MNRWTRLLRGTGRRRAVDFIAAVKAERDAAIARAVALEARLSHADDLIVSLWCANNRLMRDLTEAVADRDLIAEGHQYLLTEHDELAHRLLAANAELANLKPVHVPAPADWPDDADTHELPARTLWDTLNTPAAA